MLPRPEGRGVWILHMRFYRLLVILLIFVVISTPLWADTPPTFSFQLGIDPPVPAQLSAPYGVAVDGAGNVYVVDVNLESVLKFDGSGNYITQWGGYGTAIGQFHYPEGVATDSSNNVYVVEFVNNRVQKFDSNGNPLAQWGSSGTNNGQFNGPVGVVTDSSNNVYVADSAQ